MHVHCIKVLHPAEFVHFMHPHHALRCGLKPLVGCPLILFNKLCFVMIDHVETMQCFEDLCVAEIFPLCPSVCHLCCDSPHILADCGMPL